MPPSVFLFMQKYLRELARRRPCIEHSEPSMTKTPDKHRRSAPDQASPAKSPILPFLSPAKAVLCNAILLVML